MLKNILYKIFGTRNQRLLKAYYKKVNQINLLEPQIEKLSDDELKNYTQVFKTRIAHGENLNDILVEAFAVCREASKRVLNMRHFDVQIIGGMVLHDGKIAEMRTGEGKTLSATLPVYLNALSGNGAHVITVNDYLVKRDALEMSKLYNFLGLSVGVNLPDMPHQDKQNAYKCDITYGTNNEFGFDYLRDNMVFDIADKVQRGLHFGVVDEVDSILIDEARTPLIISGAAEGDNQIYLKLNKIPSLLTKQENEESLDGDFWVDEKNHNIILSEAGHEKVEQILLQMGLLKDNSSLYDGQNISLMHHLLASLKAHHVYLKDQHYVVQDGEIVIVDEFTGRLMNGRRWSDGLHQAVEAKEGVDIKQENHTMASITFQNYFRMYKKLSGMTGTADTEAYEFQQIYNLETVIIPTHRQMIRKDYNDKIYMNLQDKYNSIVEEIVTCHSKAQPVLVGTTSVENSEILSKLLSQKNLKHAVLNAKQHQKEADIIAQAGKPYSITVATNMAGRGTDIVLGGNCKPEITKIQNDDQLSIEQKTQKINEIQNQWTLDNKTVLDAGGLAIIGTERHESRRIDNQLRGRAGRQGDNGTSRFYLSLDDSLLRIFGGDKMRSMMQRFGMKDGESIEHKWLSRSIESAQRKVEGHNFDIRKQLLEYDNVFNEQRNVIYQERDDILISEDLNETISGMIAGVIGGLFDQYISSSVFDEKEVITLQKMLSDNYLIEFDLLEKLNDNDTTIADIKDALITHVNQIYQNKINMFIGTIKNEVDEFIINDIFANFPPNLKLLDDFCMQNGIEMDVHFEDMYKANPNVTVYEIKNKINDYTKNMGKTQATKMERGILLQHIDYYWREHLTQLEQLKQGIHLRGYAQKDPKREFQNEAFKLFATMLDNIKNDAIRVLLAVKLKETLDGVIDTDTNGVNATTSTTSNQLISRNALCDCGSGKKYKHCHGKLN